MIHTLYKTTNNKNDKFYIGVHSTDDVGFGTDTWVDDYVGSGKGISRALKKYGRESFNVEIIAYFDNEDYAYDAERDLVTEEWLTSNRDRTYNMTPGGNRPPKSTSKSGKKAHQTAVSRGTYCKPPKHQGNDHPTKRLSARLKVTGANSPTRRAEVRTKMIWAARNRKRLVCPYCGISGANSQMNRYHMHNCKKAI